MRGLIKYALLLGLLLANSNVIGQTQERTRILLLLDASGSMNNSWSAQNSTSKMNSAKRILMELVDSLGKNPDVEIALRIYGHLSQLTSRNCEDTRLEVGFSRNSASFIKKKLSTLRPKGITPIAYSLKQAASDFPSSNARNIVILMTDGEESCEGDPCEVARQLEAKGIVLKHFVIGIGLEGDFQEAFNCFGSLFEAKDPNSLKNALGNIIARIVNESSTEVQLLNKDKAPIVTNKPMLFFDKYTRNAAYTFYHQLNAAGKPDSLNIDPITDYDLKIYSLPETIKKGIALNPNAHNIVKQAVVEGSLEVNILGNTLNNNLNNQIKCLLKKSDGSLFHVQELNSTEKYLAGKYDVELLTLPRRKMQIEIKAGETKKIDIPTPGIANIKKPYKFIGDIYSETGNKLIKIYAIQERDGIETVALQAGKYKLVYRLLNAESMHQTKTLSFEIKSGESIVLNL